MTVTSAKPQQVLPQPVQLLTVPRKTEAAKRKTFTPRDGIHTLVKLRKGKSCPRPSIANVALIHRKSLSSARFLGALAWLGVHTL